MIFDTWTFAVFATVAIVAFWTIVPVRLRPLFLILAGCVFYAWAVPAYLVLIAGLGGFTFVVARFLVRAGAAPAARRVVFALAIVVIVGALAYFKYGSFLATTVATVARLGIVPAPAILVPLGISFFTFEFVHVLVDAYRRTIDAPEYIDFATFALFFPTLVAGPIKRYQTFAPQVRARVVFSSEMFSFGAYRIALGVFKKVAVANSARALCNPIVNPSPASGMLDYWVAWLAYAIEIYADFSGYSDIAIGTAALLGFEIPENFSRPYFARNLAQFWRRWHVSLSSWVRDYVFVPLGGSRRTPLVVAANLMVAMGVIGLWHGAAWTYVLWGLWHGAGLVTQRFWSVRIVPHVALLRRGGPVVSGLSMVSTFSFVALGWVLFASPSVGGAVAVYRGMFGL